MFEQNSQRVLSSEETKFLAAAARVMRPETARAILTMAQTQQSQKEIPFAPEEAASLAKIVRARMELRRKNRAREDVRRALVSLFSFGVLKPPANGNCDEEREVWEDVGDEMRLAMLDIAADRNK